VKTVATKTGNVGRVKVCEFPLVENTTLVGRKAELEPVSVTTAPGADPVNVTVTPILLPPTIVPPATEIDDNVTTVDVCTEITPPLAVTGRELPALSATTAFPTEIATEPLAADDRETVTTAATPLAMPVAFNPVPRHIVDPLPVTQMRLFPELVKAGPVVTLRDATAVAG
jgi:hypothetical protein